MQEAGGEGGGEGGGGAEAGFVGCGDGAVEGVEAGGVRDWLRVVVVVGVDGDCCGGEGEGGDGGLEVGEDVAEGGFNEGVGGGGAAAGVRYVG